MLELVELRLTIEDDERSLGEGQIFLDGSADVFSRNEILDADSEVSESVGVGVSVNLYTCSLLKSGPGVEGSSILRPVGPASISE